jgi:hypothetical protein
VLLYRSVAKLSERAGVLGEDAAGFSYLRLGTRLAFSQKRSQYILGSFGGTIAEEVISLTSEGQRLSEEVISLASE